MLKNFENSMFSLYRSEWSNLMKNWLMQMIRWLMFAVWWVFRLFSSSMWLMKMILMFVYFFSTRFFRALYEREVNKNVLITQSIRDQIWWFWLFSTDLSGTDSFGDFSELEWSGTGVFLTNKHYFDFVNVWFRIDSFWIKKNHVS